MMLDYIIIGAAQAGLSMAYHLNKMGKKYLVVDGGKEVGHSWLIRWDSLTLFTPTEYNHLPGLKFDAPVGHYPNKFEVANYFKSYVDEFNIPIEFNTLITSVKKVNGIFILSHENGTYESKNVIVATGPFHIPYTPPCATKVSDEIFQIHSNNYKSASQLKGKEALVVGGGDSGYQILDEVSKDGSKQVYFSGDTSVKTLPQQFLGKTLWWWFTISGFLSFNKYTWAGKKISAFTQPVIGTDVKEILARKNVHIVGRTNDAQGKELRFEKESISSIESIVWATGYRPNFTWIEGLELDNNHYPKNHRGVSNINGLYFIGLPWMYTRGSATLGGVAKDADYLAKKIKGGQVLH